MACIPAYCLVAGVEHQRHRRPLLGAAAVAALQRRLLPGTGRSASRAFGRPMPEVLTDIAPVLSPQVARVLATSDSFSIENLSMMMQRHGQQEETVWTYSFSPVQGESGGYEGVLPPDILVDPARRAVDQRRGPRLHRRAGERQRPGRRRGSPASIAEAGSHRPTHRWRRPRLQQPADRDQVVD